MTRLLSSGTAPPVTAEMPALSVTDARPAGKTLRTSATAPRRRSAAAYAASDFSLAFDVTYNASGVVSGSKIANSSPP